MIIRGLKVSVGLVFALYCSTGCSASRPGSIVFQKPIASITWGRVDSLAFSPDGKYLAVAGISPQWIHPDAPTVANVACWRVADWKRVATPRLDAYYSDLTGWKGKLVWTPDSTKLVIYDSRFTIMKGNVPGYKTRTCVWSRDGWRRLSTTEVNTEGDFLDVSPDGCCYASATSSPSGSFTHDIGVWDLHTGSIRFNININVDPAEKSKELSSLVIHTAYSSDGKWLAASQGVFVCLVNVATRAVVGRRRMPDNVNIVQFQPNTQNLLVVYGDASYQLLAAPDLTPVLPPVTSDNSAVVDVQFSKDGKWFAVARLTSSSKVPDMRSIMTVMTLMETASMKVFGTIGPVKDYGEKLALSPDGSTVVLGTLGKPFVDAVADCKLFVFPTSKPGAPSPDEWLKAHAGSTTPATGKPALPPMTPSGTAGH